jgi:hypothetical protein
LRLFPFPGSFLATRFLGPFSGAVHAHCACFGHWGCRSVLRLRVLFIGFVWLFCLLVFHDAGFVRWGCVLRFCVIAIFFSFGTCWLPSFCLLVWELHATS